MRFAKFWLRRDADGSPHVTEDPEEAQNWRKTGVGVIELRPGIPDAEQRLREENEQLKEAIRRLGDQDATLSVVGGNVIVEMDVTLTPEEREAIQEVIDYLQPAGQRYQNHVAATLRGLLERTK